VTEPPIPSDDERRDEERGRTWPLIVLPIVWLVLGVAGGIGIVSLVRADDAPEHSARTTTDGPTEPATSKAKSKKPKKPKESAEPTTAPTAEPTTEPTTVAPPSRTVPVSVYNQIGIGGLARRVAGQAQALGWPIGAVADWRGAVPQDTVYHPAGLEAEAALLAADLGISRVMPATATMSGTSLTVVLASPR